MSATDKKKLDKILFNTSESTGAEIFNSATNVASGINAHAEGEDTIAAGKDSHAENYLTRAYGDFSHAEGWRTVALGAKSHAEGSSPCPFDDDEYSHQLTKGTNPSQYSAKEIFDIWNARPANKKFTMAVGNWSHAQNQGNLTIGTRSHAEGWNTAACCVGGHTEGIGTITAWKTPVDPDDKAVNAQHVEGSYNIISPEKYLHIVGNGKKDDERSNAHMLDKFGNAWYAGTIKIGGHYDKDNDTYVNAKQVATLDQVTDLGYNAINVSSGTDAHAEGYQTRALGDMSHAANYLTTAKGIYSHAEGYRTIALGEKSHAEGSTSEILENPEQYVGKRETVFEIWNNRDLDKKFNMAYGNWSHTENQGTLALGNRSHAEGWACAARAVASHAEGVGTITGDSVEVSREYCGQHVQGVYNDIMDAQKYLHVVGNGTSSTNRSNAHTLQRDGQAWFAKDIYIGGTYDPLTDQYDEAKRVLTTDDLAVQANGTCESLGIHYDTLSPEDYSDLNNWYPSYGQIYFKIID